MMATGWSWRRRAWLVLVPAALILGTARWWPGWYWSWRTETPVRRGARLAAREGCLSCHGPMGRDETSNPGSRWGTVPSFFRGNAMMYVKSPDDVAYFIAEGHAPSTDSQSEAPQRDSRPPFTMRAFKSRLSKSQIQDLAAFVLAADGFQVPSEGPAAKGSELSTRFGCESCHGVGGSGGVPNPKSFTGTVPGWVGPDFAELVSTQGEFREWVLNGRSSRMRRSFGASYFLDRASLQMPSFSGALKDQDVDNLWAYIQWLRSNSSHPGAK